MKYLVKFWSGESTTTGTPNEKTGHFSIACGVEVYNNQAIEINSNGVWDKVVSKKELRKYFLGFSVNDFNYHVENFIEKAI
jgi:hypothetical protein